MKSAQQDKFTLPDMAVLKTGEHLKAVEGWSKLYQAAGWR